ncbi:D-alanine--D-alanine ligase [Kribbella sandramycini]|uniref:D-alanine--D-alanine ligase n=1 Tax=Kribbella sandramycini TaxID=60450 RepID=A0A7Y4P160_9ACTN|nr:D-alanine--D-alanine ligase [Kribbella sandramycini]MBB6565544.1 D-alanine-D-alanine ligase [Kribbella sandramycini]NOL41810.1 D-alanine--D-alanine ligase [Kribbella sandramycini]
MSDLGRVLVLAGGLSHERDVSLRSGRRVADALRSVGVEVEQRDVDASLVERLREDRPDAIFPVLHGVTGEDGALRQVLDLYGVPYVGAEPAACRTAFDKPVASTMVGKAGLFTPPSVVLGHDTFRELGAGALMDAVVQQVGLPLVVKPARGGSALGASIVRSVEELPAAMVNCYAYGPVALIEKYIDGIEVAVTVVDTGDGPRALPAVEIVPDSGFYDYEARYTAGATEFVVPARLSPEVAGACAAAAVTAHVALGLRDLSRSDLVVDADGVPWFLEVNVAPGMTETSLVPLAAEAAGIELGVLCRDLLAAAAAR